MQLKKKAQILTRKRRWQKLGVNLVAVYQEVKAEGKPLISVTAKASNSKTEE